MRAPLSPAEAIAASHCWISRWRGVLGPAVDTANSYWHPATCVWCPILADELMAKIKLSNDLAVVDLADVDAWKSYRKLSKKAQAARVHEAQEPRWYEGEEPPL